jgi:DNA-binding NarL/FixJ family response regulator
MTLPIDPAHAAALVADDDEFFRMAAVAILRSRLGFAATIEATSLTEALCHAGSAAPPIGLALVDLRMPGVADMNSLSVVRATLPAARVVVVSASRRRADVLGALGIGAHGYVWKAAGAGELEKSLRAVLAGEVSIPAFVAEFEADPPPLRDAARTASAGTLTDRQRDVLRHIVQGASNK